MKNQCFPKKCAKTLILNPFWEAKNHDFRIFFNVFGKQISNNVLGAPKIEKISILDGVDCNFGPALRNVRPAGERIREGSEAS